MKAFRFLAAAALSALLAPASAGAQSIPAGGYRSPPPAPPSIVHHGGGHHGFPVIFFPIERPVVYVEREVVREVPVVATAAAAPPAPPPPPRKPYVIGRTYDALPGGCMKMIDEGASYFLCSGEWYRQVGSSSYKAVAKP